MPSQKTPSLSVLLLDPRQLRSSRFLLSIAQTPCIALVGCARTLTHAYDMTEHEHPDLVVIAEEAIMHSGFPMYSAMLDALEIERLVITSERHPPARPGACVSIGDIERAGGLGACLARRCGATAAPPVPARAPLRPERNGGWKPVLIGASTGGIEALIEVLSVYPEAGPPTLIVQHIAAGFVPGLALRLDRHCAARVRPARHGDAIEPGVVLLAPGDGTHLQIAGSGRRCHLSPGAPVSGHRPSVDALFRSGARIGPGTVGVLLTGMGRDGAEGLAAMRRAGGWTIGQDRASSTVYGMPRAASEIGALAQQLPLERIGAALLDAAAQPVNGAGHA